ncbi:MAG TPA: UDP-N-acetylglucosamine 2-epimerase (non-hydrolyzing) [Nitrososphaeraceae archaeon]|jgi:UDP-N-acetylglucosamine 2-epimerase (non-hydrolysing)
MKKIVSVVGARPNFVKLAPIHRALNNVSSDNSITHTIIHTGQHYDYNLSKIFFKEFGIPDPDFDLDVGSGTAGFQIGEMIKRIESVFLGNSNIDLVLVYGDTNSTFAGALAAKNSRIKVAHIESGLRSFDRRMPEEINRVLTDHISDYLFAPTDTAVKNLEREHVFGRIFNTGDIAVEIVKEAALLSETRSSILNDLKLKPKSYILFTMHRSENTSAEDSLISVIRAFEILSSTLGKSDVDEATTIVFPIHPRTANLLKHKNLYARLEACKNVKLIDPVGYLDFINLIKRARKVITDSGGAQKEAYLLAVPCVTIRKNTEWIETVNEGWNILTDTDTIKIVKAAEEWTPLTDARLQNRSIFGEGRTSTIIKDLVISILK